MLQVKAKFSWSRKKEVKVVDNIFSIVIKYNLVG